MYCIQILCRNQYISCSYSHTKYPILCSFSHTFSDNSACFSFVFLQKQFYFCKIQIYTQNSIFLFSSVSLLYTRWFFVIYLTFFPKKRIALTAILTITSICFFSLLFPDFLWYIPWTTADVPPDHHTDGKNLFLWPPHKSVQNMWFRNDTGLRFRPFPAESQKENARFHPFLSWK